MVTATATAQIEHEDPHAALGWSADSRAAAGRRSNPSAWGVAALSISSGSRIEIAGAIRDPFAWVHSTAASLAKLAPRVLSAIDTPSDFAARRGTATRAASTSSSGQASSSIGDITAPWAIARISTAARTAPARERGKRDGFVGYSRAYGDPRGICAVTRSLALGHPHACHSVMRSH